LREHRLANHPGEQVGGSVYSGEQSNSMLSTICFSMTLFEFDEVAVGWCQARTSLSIT